MRYELNIVIKLILILLLASACGKIIDPEEPTNSGTFSFSVIPEGPMQTKSAMINSQDQLRLNCTPTDKEYPVGSGVYGKGNAIGIWADKVSPGGLVAKNEFDGVNLKWVAGGGHEDTNTHDPDKFYWNTFSKEGDPGNVYWHEGETYYFRAYYPASMYSSVLPNTNAQAFIAAYNAQLLQEDLMVGRAKAGPLTGANIDDHVSLTLKHALSALRFRFKFNNVLVSEDYLTAMWLENGPSGVFYNYGSLVFGNGYSYEGTDVEKITWSPAYTPDPGIALYKWTKEEGVYFNNTDAATAYAPGTYPGDEGQLFTECNHWIYVIPQDLHSDCYLCFQTRTGGDAVFRVSLPTSFLDSHNVTHTSFESGYMYDFLVVITELNLDVLITIRPWNILDSTYSIEF